MQKDFDKKEICSDCAQLLIVLNHHAEMCITSVVWLTVTIPTLLLNQHFVLSGKLVSIFGQGRGRLAFFQNLILIWPINNF